MKRIILYISFIFFTFTAGAQVAVSAKLDSNTITIGDQVNLTISVSNSDGAIIYFPTSDNISNGSLEVVQQRYDTTFDGEGKTISFNQISTLTSFEDGADTIADLKVRCLLPDNSLVEIPVDTLILAVSDVAVDTTLAIKDIAGIISVPYTFNDFLPWILLMALIAIAIWLAYYIYKRLKNKKPILPVVKPVVVIPEQKALADLEHLRVAGLWKNGQIKEYHTMLTDIVRTYIEAKLGISAVEMTSDQILDNYSQRRDMPQGSAEKLQHILNTADMVKFAKSEPLPTEHDRSMNYAVSFVQETAGAINAAEEKKKEDYKPDNNE